jgi:hypothetical protein
VWGSEFVNFGWVLTPLPNTVPMDGSTITVWVDGVPVGHPVYNQYRADIAGLFPNYNNSDGAVGYFYLDTTAYADGFHTIQWTAADSGGNTDGIGSRYFTIRNSSQSAKSTVRDQGIRGGGPLRPPISGGTIPIDYSTPVGIKKGYNKNIEPQIIYPDENGNINMEIRELERLAVTLENAPFMWYSGYMVVDRQLEPLPIGSTLDRERGVFYWQPGPGFIGRYRFVFIRGRQGGENRIKFITVNIRAKSF